MFCRVIGWLNRGFMNYQRLRIYFNHPEIVYSFILSSESILCGKFIGPCMDWGAQGWRPTCTLTQPCKNWGNFAIESGSIPIIVQPFIIFQRNSAHSRNSILFVMDALHPSTLYLLLKSRNQPGSFVRSLPLSFTLSIPLPWHIHSDLVTTHSTGPCYSTPKTPQPHQSTLSTTPPTSTPPGVLKNVLFLLNSKGRP